MTDHFLSDDLDAEAWQWREIGVLETPQSIGTVMSCDSRI